MKRVFDGDGKRLGVEFKGLARQEFFQLLERVRQLPGAEFCRTGKYWWVSKTEIGVNALLDLGFTIPQEIKDKVLGRPRDRAPELSQVSIKGLREYQNQAVAFFEARSGRALLTDEQGVGKTISVIGYLLRNPRIRPAVIVCPALVKFNWRNELRKWLGSGECLHVVQGKVPDPGQIKDKDLIIINYDVLDHHKEALVDARPQIVVFDEFHKIKNIKAKRSKASRFLAQASDKVLGLSGTPIEKNPAEFFNILNLVEPSLFPNQWKYLMRYCDARHNGWGWDFGGATNVDELHSLVSGVMLRRLKSEVLSEIPDKTRAVIPIDLGKDLDQYHATEAAVFDLIDSGEVPFISQFEVLKQKAASLKMKWVREWVRDFLETKEKLVLFCAHHNVVDELRQEFGKSVSVVVDGRTSPKSKEEAVRSFQEDPEIQLFIGNLHAAGEGITLTAASNVAFVELGWNPSTHDQSEDRCHRYGQENAVTCYYLIAADTIEEEIVNLIDSKREVVARITDGKTLEDADLLKTLIHTYKEKLKDRKKKDT